MSLMRVVSLAFVLLLLTVYCCVTVMPHASIARKLQSSSLSKSSDVHSQQTSLAMLPPYAVVPHHPILHLPPESLPSFLFEDLPLPSSTS